MTITDPTETVADGDPVEFEPELCWLNLADMAPHPDNPRHIVGDLTELTRSIRAHRASSRSSMRPVPRASCRDASPRSDAPCTASPR